MKEEKSIASIKVKTSDLCIKCKLPLQAHKMGSGDIFSFSSSGSGAFYCDNNQCAFFGYLTLGRIPKSEKVVELDKDEAANSK